LNSPAKKVDYVIILFEHGSVNKITADNKEQIYANITYCRTESRKVVRQALARCERRKKRVVVDEKN